MKSQKPGCMRCNDGETSTKCVGHAYAHTFNDGCPRSESVIPGLWIACDLAWRVVDLRQEPYALNAHVRICAGGPGLTRVPTATDAPLLSSGSGSKRARGLTPK